VRSLGFVAQTGLSQAFLTSDLELLGGLTGNSNFQFDLIVKNTPEPSTIVLVGLGMVGLVGAAWGRK